jgi:hypothetical protein
VPRAVPRVAVELPPAAHAAIERARNAAHQLAGGAGYRSLQRAEISDRFYPVVVREPEPRSSSTVFWPTVRTAIPASVSVGLALSLVLAAPTLGASGTVGVVLGSAVTALFARTQYTLERDQHALAGLFLASNGAAVLVARFDSLAARLLRRPRFYLVPLEHLHDAESREIDPSVPRIFRRAHARTLAVAHALRVLGIDGANVSAGEAERIHTLARLARWRARRVP